MIKLDKGNKDLEYALNYMPEEKRIEYLDGRNIKYRVIDSCSGCGCVCNNYFKLTTIIVCHKQISINGDFCIDCLTEIYKKSGYNAKRINPRTKKLSSGLRKYKRSCERCKKISNLMHMHHRDRDRFNNSSQNLELLCVDCHSEEHGWCCSLW